MNTTSGPSNNWELQTREILRNALPEYDIDPHMRLSNVVKGRIETSREMAMYEIDFCVREKATGFVLCAIELDGWQHATEDAHRKDANKNLWLEQAKIQLIRITHPDQAVNIRQLMGQQKQPGILPVNNQEFGSAGNAIAAIIIIVVGIWLIIGLINGIGKSAAPKNNNFSISSAVTTAAQKLTDPMAEVVRQRAAENKRVLDAQMQRLAQEAAEQYQAQAETQRVIAHKASFEKNYQKPAGCDNPKDMSAMIECSNHYMREKTKFNAANGYQ